MTAPTPPATLAGRRILIVEDDPLISMLEENLMLDLGCHVIGPAATVAEALVLAAGSDPQGALLDMNLQGESVFPVADMLAQTGVPFVFVTGYGDIGLPGAHSHRITIKKPFDPASFGKVVEAALTAPPLKAP